MRKINLTHLTDQRKGEIFEFTGDVLRIGRGDWNELVFAEPRHTMVSRSHSEISLRENAYVVTDNNSSTGTYLNGEKIAHAILKNGDILRFGLNGPEVSVHIPSSDLKATVVVPSLKAPVVPPAVVEAPRAARQPANAETQPVVPSEPSPPPRSSRGEQSTVIAKEDTPRAGKAEPVRFRELRREVVEGRIPAGDLAALQAQIQRLTLIACAACAILLLMAIFAIVRAGSVASRIETHAARLEKLDATTGELLQRLSTMDTQGIQQMFEKKSREMDQRARQLERRAQDMEQKFQAMFDRKSREVDAQFELLGQAYPQVRAKMDEIRRRRRN